MTIKMSCGVAIIKNIYIFPLHHTWMWRYTS